MRNKVTCIKQLQQILDWNDLVWYTSCVFAEVPLQLICYTFFFFIELVYIEAIWPHIQISINLLNRDINSWHGLFYIILVGTRYCAF